MTTTALVTAMLKTAAYLEHRHGIKIDLSALKSRDPREPKRKEKERHEKQLEALFRRIFKRQGEQIIARAGMLKALTDYDTMLFDDDFDATPDELADLIALLQRMAAGGVTLFGESVGDLIDYTLVNKRAAEAARKLALQLIDDIGETTRNAIRQAIRTFVTTPGFTIGDLAALLPFDARRAMSIAITETTRAYALGQHEAGIELKNEFPDIQVVKIWYTNNDDRVCPICAPLDGMTVKIDDGFSTEEGEGIMEPPAHVNCRCWIDYTTDIDA